MKLIYKSGDICIYSSAYMPIDERMYTILSGSECLVIDPNVDREQIEYLHRMGQKDIRVILTHCHYDHISGLNDIQAEFKCSVIGSGLCLKNIESPRKNLSKYGNLVFMAHGFDKDEVPDIKPFAGKGDISFEDTYYLSFNGHDVVLKVFPGHSPDSIFIFLDDDKVFTGDNLIPGISVCTDNPGGDRKAFDSITKPFILSIPGDTLVFPAHREHGRLKDILYNHPDYI